MKKLSLELYEKMFLVRMAEEKIREIYPMDEIKTPSHLAIGEEAIAVGVIAASAPSEVFGTYRNHGIYIAKTGDTYRFFAELFGKQTGLSKGKAGSMHIMSPDEGFMGTSAIVGSTIPLAVGAAYANMVKKRDVTTLAFFGDGAIDEGVFWESLNFACLKKIPVVFVCEDNSFAIHAPAQDRHGYRAIHKIAEQFDCYVAATETTDVEELYELTQQLLEKQKKEPKPVFLSAKYYRYLEHVGIGYDFQFGYRPEEEYKKWLEKDPLLLQRQRLLKSGLSEEKIVEIEKTIMETINKSVEKARKDPFPKIDELLTDIYYG